MKDKSVIPEMVHPLGKNWNQPLASNIAIDNEHAVMTGKDYDKLPVYNFGMPSGVYPGKMWVSKGLDANHLFWFGDEVAGSCSVNHREILIA